LVTLIIMIFAFCESSAQVCQTDSNYYSIRYSTANNSSITNGIITPQNELVALCQNTSINSSYLTKFTSQGNVLWSAEYIPDYPYVNWLQFPWYTQTQMRGLLSSSDSSYFVYGSAIEHGRTINNVEDPASHQVGLMLNINKFGKVSAGRYFGAWGTNYSVNSVGQLSDGGLIVYLGSSVSPFKSKVICINKSGDIVWGSPFQPHPLYTEIKDINPIIKQLKNGNIAILSEMSRSIDDTLIYPFLTVIVPAPLYLLNILIMDPSDGHVISHTSAEFSSASNTNIPGDFIPTIKSITELPNGDISFFADGYWPTDNVVYYEHKIFARCAINFITNSLGIYKRMITYAPENGSCSLQSVWQNGNQGDQVLLVKDSATNQLVVCGIDNTGKVEWSRTYNNPIQTEGSTGILLQKQNTNGFSIFQTDPILKSFDLLITNSIGNSGCDEKPAIKMSATESVWGGPQQKVLYMITSFDPDFRYAGFNIVQNAITINQNTYCKYQFECCRDFIDSLRPHNVTVCEDEAYTLPDNTIIRSSGTYYQTLKSKEGCDSVIFYNLKVIKSPSHLEAPIDTCMNGEPTIKLIATGGYETYLWNSIGTTDSSYEVRQPGSYEVRVENVCGSKTDTVHVYDKCEFPVYFPNAFTPNGDLLNDVLRFPPENINKLARLRIYNRYGQVVYVTTRNTDGWDGNYKNIPQPVGAYTYILEMKGLAGKKINQKGTVMLLR